MCRFSICWHQRTLEEHFESTSLNEIFLQRSILCHLWCVFTLKLSTLDVRWKIFFLYISYLSLFSLWFSSLSFLSEYPILWQIQCSVLHIVCDAVSLEIPSPSGDFSKRSTVHSPSLSPLPAHKKANRPNFFLCSVQRSVTISDFCQYGHQWRNFSFGWVACKVDQNS
jgi:hypothetical protein